MEEYCFLIDNHWVKSHEVKEIVNPYSHEKIGKVFISGREDVSNAICSASKSFNFMKKTPVFKRVELLNSIVDVLKKRKNELANTITLESGKPISKL